MNRVLVTGATGFIGSRVSRKLVKQGTSLRVVVRDPGRLDPAIAREAEVVTGDLRNPDVVNDAVQGVHTILHLAAFARAWEKNPGETEAVNFAVVRSLLDAARREGVSRVVHTSSVLAVPPYRPAGVNGRSSRPTQYETTKHAAEALIRDYVAEGGNAVIVRPTRVYGPGPLNDANGVTKMLVLYLSGRFRVLLADGDVQANYVFVDDVADGIVRAGRWGRSGQAYFLGGENSSLRRFLEIASRLSGVRRRTLRVPASVGLAVGQVSEWWGRLGGTPSFTPEWIRIFLEDRRVTSEAAREELGYVPRSLAEGLGATLNWIAREGGAS